MLLRNLIELSGGVLGPSAPQQVVSSLASAVSSPPVATVSPPVEAQQTNLFGLEDKFVMSKIMANDFAVQKKRVTDDYIHVSALKNLCPRQYALLIKMGEHISERVTSNERLVWAIGRAVENHVRESFVQSMNYEDIYGKWVCSCRKTEYEGFHRPNQVCEGCGSAATRYNELPLFDEVNFIVGNPDLMFVKDGKYYVVEIKSIKGGDTKNKAYKSFKDLDAPLGDHVFQAKMYRYLLQCYGADVADEVIILYASKEYSFKDDPMKEFHVDVSGPEDQAEVQRAVETARAVFEFLRNDAVLPPRTLCENSSTTRAMGCPVAGRCFS